MGVLLGRIMIVWRRLMVVCRSWWCMIVVLVLSVIWSVYL